MLGPYDNARVPDLAEPIMGWRAWRVCASDHYIREGQTHLESPDQNTRWPASAPLQAQWCTHHQTETDRAGCHCGINAYRTREQMEASMYTLSHGTVWGRVALWGEVREYEGGYRAEFAQIAELFISRHLLDHSQFWGFETERVAQILSTEYGVPCHIVDAVEAQRRLMECYRLREQAVEDLNQRARQAPDTAVLDFHPPHEREFLDYMGYRTPVFNEATTCPVRVHDRLEVGGRANVRAMGNASIFAHDQARVVMRNNWYEHIEVDASGNAFVEVEAERPGMLPSAYMTSLSLYGESTAIVRDRMARLSIWENAQADLHAESWARAGGSCTVRAHDRSTVDAGAQATVHAFDQAMVHAHDPGVTVHATDQSFVVVKAAATVHASGHATVHVYGAPGAQVHAADETVTVHWHE